MNRTRRNKLLYVGTVILLGGAVLFFLIHTNQPAGVFLLVALVLFIPGRIQGIYYRDLFRGRRLSDLGEWEASFEYYETFLSRIRKQPWLKHLIWLSWGMYTWDVEAMTENNLGSAKLNLGMFQEAEQHLRAAVTLDPYYPIAYYNLALLAQVQDDIKGAQAFLERSKHLGYKGGAVDGFVQQATAILARLEGRGISQDKQDSKGAY